MKIKTIAIIGLGLMGGSLARACRRTFPGCRIIGISRNPKALALALKNKWIHEASEKLTRDIGLADLIVLATPVDVFPKYLLLLDSLAKPGAMVTDVGSVKGELIRWMEKRSWSRIRFVGAHPMVGSHERGITAAEPHLYAAGMTFLIRSKKTDLPSYRIVKRFWEKLGQRVVELDGRTHDKIVGEISHLPHAVAACLVHAASNRSLPFAASGFRDTTRIAQGDVSVWLPIFMANRREILNALVTFEKKLGALKSALSRSDKVLLRKILYQAGRKRAQI